MRSGNLKHFLRMAKDLNIPAAAIFDGDHAKEKSEAEKEFPNSLLELLPTDDIRDKPGRDQNGRETDTIAKEGLFDRHGKLKPNHEAYFTALLKKVSEFFAQH
jgi:hypothetical protein